MSKLTAAAKAGDADYVPTDRESEAARRLIERRRSKAKSPRFKVEVRNGATNIEPNHEDATTSWALVYDALATGESAFVDGLLGQLANVARSGKELKASELDFVVAAVREIGPRDPTETLLACQMVAIHNSMMVAARRIQHVETLPQQDSASNMLNKLARTFAAQVEALKKYRSTGEQSIRVQYVTVSAGQAVVGITQGGGGTHEKPSQSHAPGAEFEKQSSSADERGAPLLGNQQAIRMPLPSTGCEEAAGVPDARRASGSAEGRG